MNYKFVQDDIFYYNLFEKYRDEGNLAKAAEFLNESIRLRKDIKYLTELALLYSEMGQLDMSNAVCFEVLMRDHRNNDCLTILSNNFTEKKNFRAAYFYFTKFDYYGIEELTEFVVSDAEAFDISRLGFKLVWSNGKKDTSDIKDEAEFYISLKDYNQAIEILNTVPSNSFQYLWSMKMLVFCYYMNEDYYSALKLTDELIKNDECDISLMAVNYNILIEIGEVTKATIIIDKMLTMKCKDINDVYKLSYCLMDSKRYFDVINLIHKEFSKYPYDDNLYILLASAYYMTDNIPLSKRYLLKLINMYQDRTFAKLYLDCFNKGEKCDGNMLYGIPQSKAIKYNKIIDKYNHSKDVFKKAFIYNPKFKNILKWRIKTQSDDGYSYMLISNIGLLNNSTSAKFLEEILIDNSIGAVAKINALCHLFKMGKNKRIALVYDSYFRIINMIDVKDSSMYFIEAYAICCVYLAPILKDYEDEIYKSFNYLYERLKDNFNRLQSSEAFAALILYYCDNLDINKDHKIVTGLFNATITTFRKYLKIVENYNDNVRKD